MAHITDFWFGHYQTIDKAILNDEVNGLPPLEALNPMQMTRIPYFLGRLGAREGWEEIAKAAWKKIDKSWIAAALPKIDRFNPQDLSNTIQGFANLGIVPPEKFLKRFYGRAENERDRFTPQQSASTLRSSAILGVVPPEKFLDAVTERVTADLDKLDLQDPAGIIQGLTGIVWAMAIFSVVKPLPQKYHEFLSLVCREIDSGNLDKIGSSMYSAACFRLFPEQAKALPDGADASSKSEDLFVARLVRAGAVECKEARYIPKLGTFVDCVLEKNAGLALIQYDGTYHDLEDHNGVATGFDGGTLLMTANIRQERPEQPLIRVPQRAGNKLSDSGVREFVDRVKEIKPGAYMLKGSSFGPVFLTIPLADTPFETGKRPGPRVKAEALIVGLPKP
jgi:hypothetical protein